jgi:tRNA(fMet)-specific endonuclease VapC
MKARYMMDTDICIYLTKQRPPEIRERFLKLHPGEVVISLITFGELYNGALRSRESTAALTHLRLLAERLPVQPMSIHVAKHYGSIRRELEHKGTIIDGNDLWIAAHAQALKLTLITNNIREFSRVPELQVENWVDGH